MRHTTPTHRVVLVLPLFLAAVGCELGDPAQQAAPKKPAANPPQSPTKRVEMGKNVAFEVTGNRRRVIVEAYVCLREGQLEQLLCRKFTKEHEAILAADVDARDIHKALLLTGVEPGSTVRWQPEFQPPRGPAITITLEYEDKGKVVSLPAQKWVRVLQTKKELAADWVFAGSYLAENPLDKERGPVYGANSGDVICVSNFEDAMLDLPIKSPKDNAELAFEAFAERIPPLETKVRVILEPKKPAIP